MAPRYLQLSISELRRRADRAGESLRSCGLCGHQCGVDRLRNELGRCRTGPGARVASVNAHFGEEPPITGVRGSGTVFFSGCPMSCVFCQNWPISQLDVGRDMAADELAEKLLGLQARGCHNINLVTATHQVPALLEALAMAVERGLSLPIVHNTAGFDSEFCLELLDGIVDVYLPDIKYDDNDIARRVSNAGNYVEVNRRALRVMLDQVGGLETDAGGLAESGLIVRHLVLPDGLAGERGCFEFLARLDSNVHVSLMTQYFPAHRAVGHAELGRCLTEDERDAARSAFFEAGLGNGWVQEDNGSEEEPG